MTKVPGLLHDEIRQRRPLPLRTEAYLNVVRTAAQLDQSSGRFFRAFGLTPPQYNVLRILAGSHPDWLPCGEVGERLVSPVPDVTRLLDRLEEKVLIARRRDAADRRVVRVTITEQGLALLARVAPALDDWLAEAIGHLEDAELRRLVDLLEQVRRAAPQ